MSHTASTVPTLSVPPTGIDWIDGILWGEKWDTSGTSGTINYILPATSLPDGTILTWDADEITAIKASLQGYADVSGLNFVEVTSLADDDLRFLKVNDTVLPGVLGVAGPPGEPGQGEILINSDAYFNPSVGIGGFDYVTFVHEIGHALGLAHPHDNGGTSTIYPGVTSGNDSGPDGLNDILWTAMSFIDTESPFTPGTPSNFGFVSGPMTFDIFATQYLYGVNLSHNTGNNTYVLPTQNTAGTFYTAIWDAGGIDTISGISATASVTINLNNATLDNNDPNAGGYVSRVNGIFGGYTIAYDWDGTNVGTGITIIENATGSDFGDDLIGNAYDNLLSGRGGNDNLDGLAGNDTLNGNGGQDHLSGGANDDLLNGGGKSDTLIGNSGNDELFGGLDSDVLHGGSGRDILTGEDGDDSLTGGGGDDRLFGNAGEDTLRGESGNDLLFSNGQADFLRGDAGNDTLNGGGGNDNLNGADISLFGVGERDELTGGSGSDIFILGIASGVLYDDGQAGTAGTADRATVMDFNQTEDIIRLQGDANKYAIKFSSALGGMVIALDSNGNNIFNASQGEEVIAVLSGLTSFNLSANYVVYV